VKWFIVFHLFGVIFWLGGLLIVSTMLAAAADETGAGQAAVLKLAYRLFNSACNAGAAITIVFGILIVINEPEVMRHGWMHVKLALVGLLIVLHIWMYVRGRRIVGRAAAAVRREFQVVHGLVSIVLLAILVMLIMQPF
jgi:protoporphyrinogen IX oxidase